MAICSANYSNNRLLLKELTSYNQRHYYSGDCAYDSEAHEHSAHPLLPYGPASVPGVDCSIRPIQPCPPRRNASPESCREHDDDRAMIFVVKPL
jgi:hypothetical protein